MAAFFVWYIILTVLGWLTFPLLYLVFPALMDRGYTLARTAGLLIWGYVFWLFASLGISQNDMGGMLVALALLAVVSVWSVIRQTPEAILEFLRARRTLVITTEILFFAAFAFLAVIRSANPELTSTEKPMELAFINGILRSSTFPPQDPWLSGYAISYYYFGYVMTAMLARFSGINGSTAHNLMTSLVFALGALGSYGILFNVLYPRHGREADLESEIRPPHGAALLAPLFLLLVSNFEAMLEVWHRLGLFWTKDVLTGEWISPFWTWLDMKELSLPPAEPFGWLPDRYLWWWRASRVIQDYDMLGAHLEVIDEFPFFSFLLGDLHPHVLAIPFNLLAISAALNLFLGGWQGEVNLSRARLRLHWMGLAFSALVIGGLAFLNTWDILIGATLIVAAYVLVRAREDGWSWARLEDLMIFTIPLGTLSLLLYFPFHLGFSSQAGGLLPNFMYPTRGIHLWVMWGTLLIPIFLWLIHAGRGEKLPANWKLGLILGLAAPALLFLLTFVLGWAGSVVEKEFVAYFLVSQDMDAAQFLKATSLRRGAYLGSLITLLAVLIPGVSFLFGKSVPLHPIPPRSDQSSVEGQPHLFVLMLMILGGLLVLAPEFVYLRDQFGYRINTVFKFYYQAWMLWSLAAAYGTAMLMRAARGSYAAAVRVLIGGVVFAGLLYPALGLMTKTNNFQPMYGFTLNDFERVQRENPDEAAAVEFLLTAPEGILVEAVGDGYSGYARISMLTGLQTVLGWPGHESQWRGTRDPQGSRREDVARLYATSSWDEAEMIIEQYQIRYVYIGALERISMPVNELKFQSHLNAVFQQGGSVIYEVP